MIDEGIILDFTWSVFKTKKRFLLKEFWWLQPEVRFQARTVTLSSITLKLEKGRTYYLQCGLRSGLLYPEPGFDLLLPADGANRAAELRK